ncbi:MAG TPA: alanine--glyoxylate aminotransferase family protein [Longimicrobiales bacterium]|nr:alanine--glyoxylate aminotransferase family protein [Longimicrobiales bacterium]
MTHLDRPYGRFFLPGPTEVHPDVLQAQARPPIGHRGPEMRALMAALQPGLRAVFGTERPVAVSTSSATGLMETAIRCGVRRKLLCLVNGAFSQRFADIAASCGVAHEILEVGWGAAHTPGPVADRLASGEFDAVSLVHSETSTGALNDIPSLLPAIRQHPDVQMLVDSVTGIGGAEFRTDAWGVDFVVTGSQKALAVPPGLAFAVASERFLDRARTIPGRGTYLDVVGFYEQLEQLQTPTTPAVTLLYALQVQLERILAEGMEARIARHAAMARRTWAWVEELQAERDPAFRVLAPREWRSPTVTCVRLPRGISGPEVVAGVAERGWVIGGGYGKLKSESFRIGHMGDHTLEALEDVLGVLADVLTAAEVRS